MKDEKERQKTKQKDINQEELQQEVIRKKMVASIGKGCGGEFLHECKGYYGTDISRVCYSCPN